MEMISCSKMLANLQWTTWHYIPDNRTLHNHCCRNLQFSLEVGQDVYMLMCSSTYQNSTFYTAD
jgi:hypothetical protein